MIEQNLTYKKESISEKLAVFRLSGKILNSWDAKHLKEEIETLAHTPELDNVIFVLSELTYMTSSGLNCLLFCLTKLRNNAKELTLCEVSEKVENLLIITKLNTVFSVYKTMQEAIQSTEIKTIKQ